MEKKKLVQFVALFQILEGCHPMVVYEKKKPSYYFIGVLKTPKCIG